MTARFWDIRIYHSSQQIAEIETPTSRLTEKNLKLLLQVLAAKHGRLTDDEILDCFVRRRSGDRKGDPLLHVTKENAASGPIFACGENPHVVAKVIEK